jgi:hypothetical protein
MQSLWSDLPENLGMQIFGRVRKGQGKGGLAASRLVCKSWCGFSTASVKKLVPRRIFKRLAGWRGVTSLDLKRCKLSSLERGFARSGFHSLTAVDCHKLTDDLIRHLRRLTGLTALDLSKSEVSANGLWHLRRLTGLTVLNLSYTDVSAKGLWHLRRLTGLTALDLSDTDVSAKGLRHLSRLTALTMLDLHNACIEEEELRMVAGLRSLTELVIYSCYTLTDGAMLQLRPLTGLTKLFLDTSFSVTDAGVEVVRSMPLLRELELNVLGDVTDRGILAIAGLTNLTHLSLRETQKMTPVGLRALCTGLTALEWLDLHGCGCMDLRLPPLRLASILDEHLFWFTRLTRLHDLILSEIGIYEISADGDDEREESTITAAGVEQLREAMSYCKVIFYTMFP